MHAADFTMRTDHGRGLDWPIDYVTLRPFYDRIQKEAGVSGDAAAEIWRPDGEPYPMPPLDPLKQGTLLAKAFAAAEKRTAPAPINSVDYADRPACQYDGWCDAGCPIMALFNPLAAYLPRAEAAGAKIVADTPVTRIVPRGRGGVKGVQYRTASSRIAEQRARLVVLAGSVVGNPALMLNSADVDHPTGIGNANDLMGRHVMTHGLILILGLFPQETEPHRGVTGAHLICHDDYAKTAAKGAFGSRQWLIAPSIKPNDLAGLAVSRMDLNGPALDGFLGRAVRHAANMIGMCEQEPDADTKRLWEAMRDEGMAIFKAGGATEGGVNPTFTVNALALRTVEHLLDERRDLFAAGTA